MQQNENAQCIGQCEAIQCDFVDFAFGFSRLSYVCNVQYEWRWFVGWRIVSNASAAWIEILDWSLSAILALSGWLVMRSLRRLQLSQGWLWNVRGSFWKWARDRTRIERMIGPFRSRQFVENSPSPSPQPSHLLQRRLSAQPPTPKSSQNHPVYPSKHVVTTAMLSLDMNIFWRFSKDSCAFIRGTWVLTQSNASSTTTLM